MDGKRVSRCCAKNLSKRMICASVRRLRDVSPTGGNVEMARACLGRGYKLEGTIVEGHHKGTLLGFPTANLKPECPSNS